MLSAIGQVTAHQSFLLAILIVSLPFILIGISLAFVKGAGQIQKNPKFFMLLGFFLGISYAGLFAYALTEQANIRALVTYGLFAVLWPLFGFLQYRAKTKVIRAKG